MQPSRRQFLKTAAVAAASAAGVQSTAKADGPSYAVQGIDVSYWQGPSINWTSVAASGKKFAIIRATRGVSYTDPYFAANWAAAKSVGLIRGSYHYGFPEEDPVRQARIHYRTVKPGSGDLPLVCDFEKPETGLSAAALRNWCQRYCLEMKRLQGKPPIIYTGFYYWRDEAGNSPHNYDCKLWHARYDTQPLPIAAAWTSWTMWQYSSTGSVPGVTGNCDLDAFNGTLTQLQSMVMP